MRGYKTLIAILAVLLVVSSGQVLGQQDRVLTGKVTSLSVDDPTASRGFTRNERRFAVRVGLSGVPDTLVLGFGESGSPITPFAGMLDLLRTAMENDWTVQLRLSRDADSSGNAAHATIVSVTISR